MSHSELGIAVAIFTLLSLTSLVMGLDAQKN